MRIVTRTGGSCRRRSYCRVATDPAMHADCDTTGFHVSSVQAVAADPAITGNAAQVVSAAARRDQVAAGPAMHAVTAVWLDRAMGLLALFSAIAGRFETFRGRSVCGRAFALRPGRTRVRCRRPRAERRLRPTSCRKAPVSPSVREAKNQPKQYEGLGDYSITLYYIKKFSTRRNLFVLCFGSSALLDRIPWKRLHFSNLASMD